jgi:hypothetical protein
LKPRTWSERSASRGQDAQFGTCAVVKNGRDWLASCECFAPLPAPAQTDADGVVNKRHAIDNLRHKIQEGPLHEYEDRDVINPAHGGALNHPGVPKTNAEQIAQQSER